MTNNKSDIESIQVEVAAVLLKYGYTYPQVTLKQPLDERHELEVSEQGEPTQHTRFKPSEYSTIEITAIKQYEKTFTVEDLLQKLITEVSRLRGSLNHNTKNLGEKIYLEVKNFSSQEINRERCIPLVRQTIEEEAPTTEDSNTPEGEGSSFYATMEDCRREISIPALEQKFQGRIAFSDYIGGTRTLNGYIYGDTSKHTENPLLLTGRNIPPLVIGLQKLTDDSVNIGHLLARLRAFDRVYNVEINYIHNLNDEKSFTAFVEHYSNCKIISSCQNSFTLTLLPESVCLIDTQKDFTNPEL